MPAPGETTITLSIERHPRGGYLIKYPGTAYESCNADIYNPDKATRFEDYIAVCAYVERSWPAYSTWCGSWVDNTHYRIVVS